MTRCRNSPCLPAAGLPAAGSYLADEARRAAFSSGLLLLLVQAAAAAAGGGGGESGAHSYHRPVLLLCSAALHLTLLLCWCAPPYPRQTQGHLVPLDHILAQMSITTLLSTTNGPGVKGLKPYIFLAPKILSLFACWFFSTPCGSFLRLVRAGAIKEASEAWQTGRRF